MHKEKGASVDLEVTETLFHDKASFQTYSSIPLEVVHASHGETRSIAKGTVNITIDGGIIQEAYKAPQFSSHIIAAALLSDHFEIFMSSSLKNEKDCLLFKKGAFAVHGIVWQTPVVHGL